MLSNETGGRPHYSSPFAFEVATRFDVEWTVRSALHFIAPTMQASGDHDGKSVAMQGYLEHGLMQLTYAAHLRGVAGLHCGSMIGSRLVRTRTIFHQYTMLPYAFGRRMWCAAFGTAKGIPVLQVVGGGVQARPMARLRSQPCEFSMSLYP